MNLEPAMLRGRSQSQTPHVRSHGRKTPGTHSPTETQLEWSRAGEAEGEVQASCWAEDIGNRTEVGVTQTVNALNATKRSS